MPFGIQPLDILVIVILGLVLFGPQKLPEIARGIGKGLTEFRKGAREMSKGFKEEVSKPIDPPAKKIYPNPAVSQPVVQVSQPPVVIPGEPAQDADSSRIFCNQCGEPNPAEAQFCIKCGAKIAAD